LGNRKHFDRKKLFLSASTPWNGGNPSIPFRIEKLFPLSLENGGREGLQRFFSN
jgi:hypothetical protein